MNLFDKLPKMTEADRKHIFEIADFFLELNTIARREGVLTLDDYCNKDAWKYGADKLKPLQGVTQHEIDVFHILFSLAINCTPEKDAIQEIAKNFIDTSGEIGGAKLALMIGAQAIVSIITFESTDLLRIRLASMMNWPFCVEYYDGSREE